MYVSTLGYERVYLPLQKVANKPFPIYGGDVYFLLLSGTIFWPNVGMVLGQRGRRCTIIIPTVGQRLVSVGMANLKSYLEKVRM